MREYVMQLTVGNDQYTITDAILCAYVVDPAQPRPSIKGTMESGLFWFLEVEVRDEWITFWHHDIQFPKLRSWSDIVDHPVGWNTPMNDVTGEMNGGWYGGNLISGHLEILESNLVFKGRDGCKLHLSWEGIASGAPLGNEPSADERLPFAIDCWCVFEGVDKSDKSLIAQYLDINDFVEEFTDTPHRISGMFLLKPIC